MLKRSVRACVAAAAFAGVAQYADVAGAQQQGAERARVGMIEIEGAISQRPSPFAWLEGGSAKATLRELIGTLHRTAEREDLDAVMIRLKDAALTTTQVEELGAAMKKVRESGKKVYVFSEAYGTGELLLGSFADTAIVQSGGLVMLPGLFMEEMFLADTLSWAGLKADMIQVGDYKGANEQMSRSSPSPQWNQNIEQLLDSMYANVRGHLIAGREMDDAQLDKAMDVAWMADGAQAVKVGLVDREVDLPEIGESIKGDLGKTVAWVDNLSGRKKQSIDFSNPFALFSGLGKKPEHRAKKPTIAVLHIDGAIVDGDSTDGGLFGGSSVGSRTIRNALEEILKQDMIKGVVVRVNSPGGSAIASEIMWQGIRRVAEKKPVWVSVGDMAASGGYYVAVAGERIFVNPSSIVGSIGVVGGKISMGELYKRFKVNVVARARGPRAAMFDSTRPWDEAQSAIVRGKMTETYEQFTGRVTQGRAGIDLSKTAEGRLFTGDKAIGLKMADEIGGLEDAIAGLSKKLDLESPDVMDFPGPKGFDELLQGMLGGFGVHGPAVQRSVVAREFGAVIRAAVGERNWPAVRDGIEALLQLRESPVVLTSPRALIFRW